LVPHPGYPAPWSLSWILPRGSPLLGVLGSFLEVPLLVIPLLGVLGSSLEQLGDDRLDETHVLGSSNWQPVEAKVTDHLGNRLEGTAELAQDVLAGLVALDPHVHEALGAPEKEGIRMLSFEITRVI